jgi:membrane dipeptidase
MIVIDSHVDLAWNAVNWNRDLTRSVAEIRASEAGMKEERRGHNTVAFPEMQKGQVAVCLATLLARGSGLHEPLLDWSSREIASAVARGQRAYYRIQERAGRMRMLKDWPTLKAHVDAWNHSTGGTLPLGFILSMEGADPILSPADVPRWWEDGLRVVGPAHYGPGAYASGTGPTGGLTPAGVELLKEMAKAGMVLDVTHLSEESFWQAIEHFPGPILASHNNCRALVPGPRQFSDDQIRTLIKRGAVIGAAFDSWMLYPNYVKGKTDNSLVSLSAVVDHIVHVCQLAGNALHAAIGSDLDGGFGTEQSPHELDTIADLQRIPPLLAQRGFKPADIEGVMHANWLRFFQEAWTRTS